ncbi:hypothetical protein HN954_01995 [bacterium]|nr:hypothetical protein [bacterium]MBT6831531.1 hypothetical protein [bacterium]MBT6996182.1 hypothetical protein [bacterium]MBT7772564.1 hypothetical protein [bacterium]
MSQKMEDHKKEIVQLQKETTLLNGVIQKVKTFKRGKIQKQESAGADAQLEKDLNIAWE